MTCKMLSVNYPSMQCKAICVINKYNNKEETFFWSLLPHIWNRKSKPFIAYMMYALATP